MRRKKRRRRRKQKILSKVIREAGPLLLLTIFGSAFAGSVLGKMEGVLLIIPGVMVLVPAILDLRGDVGISFGSRLSTMLHLGLIRPSFKMSPILFNNIFSALSLSFSFSAFFGILAHLLCLLLHLPSAGIVKLTLIGFISGGISSIVMIPFTLFLSIFAFRRSIDPDDIISPAIAVLGDGVAMLSLFFAASVVQKLNLPDLSLLIISLLVIKESFPTRYRFSRIFFQSSPIIIICGVLGIFAGLFLHSHESTFGAAPYLLVLLPQLISKGGSIGCISGMRLTSGIYIGYTRPFHWNSYVWKNLLAAFILSLILIIPIAVISHFSARLLHIGQSNFLFLLMLTGLNLIPLSFGTSVISFVIASLSKRIHLDPSNVVAPLITSIGDISGIFLFLLTLRLLV
ncbi:hypothetical protein BXT86_02770 [candidate division WOR-3 bacterium 4484_100]|uniref:SLC41A/MgtE integral membrane domain-containing protein n=1 Tax=candidate division WOR-3 bacterium 4484_100 TaxID=1936077 RepID=A0A1V4QGK5_UNCW3|nr:MAG: hypothetical protein BXT86_02770 [candidate division WOR-3 bacterium 4484_100]